MGHLGAKSGQILTLSDSQRDANTGGLFLFGVNKGVDITGLNQMMKVIGLSVTSMIERNEYMVVKFSIVFTF